jgi:hypothetical protein
MPLPSQADILQLDVMWLFDSFEGNSSDNQDLTGDQMYRRGAEESQIVSWADLKNMRLATVKDLARDTES